MTVFRSHVVSLLAVTMALALGIALGAGPLQREAETRPAAALDRSAVADARGRVAELRGGIAYADTFALRSGTGLVRDRLRDRAVTLLVLPGARTPTVSGLVDMLSLAGARVTTQLKVDRSLLDVGNRQLVGELGAQMASSAGRAVEVPQALGDYERMGRLLAVALTTTTNRGAPVDRVGSNVLAGLQTARLARVTGGSDARGSLVLAVTGTPYGSADQRAGAGTIASSFLRELARDSDAVVLAGPVPAGRADGLVGRLRDDAEVAERVSTVDVAGSTAGAVATVLALVADLRGASGHYGSAGSADGPLPRTR